MAMILGLRRALAVAIVVGLSIAWLVWTMTGFTLADAEAYRGASDRLVAGEALYPAVADPDAPDVYRYAPWFALAWTPIAALPDSLGNILWGSILIVASVVAVLPLARQQDQSARLLALLGGTMLLWAAARGNVHPLLIAVLIHGIDRPSGPLWVGLAASLKAVPIVFVLVYLAKRQWRRAGAAAVVTAALVAPMPLMGWELGKAHAGASISLYYLASPVIWSVVACLAIAGAAAIALFVPRHAALAAGLAAVLALPRLLLYDLTYLLVGVPQPAPRTRIASTGGR